MRLLRRHRSARSGQYVTQAEAEASPDTTVSESVDRYKEALELIAHGDYTAHTMQAIASTALNAH